MLRKRTGARKTLLFVTPTLARTGSEIALANFLSTINAAEFRIILCVRWGTAELAGDIPDHVKIVRTPFSRFFVKIKPIGQIVNKLLSGHFFRSLCLFFRPAAVYVNTITMPDVVSIANRLHIPVILHVHELEHMYAGLTPSQTHSMLEIPQRIIAASQRAAEVVRVMGRKKGVEVVYSPIRGDFEITAERETHRKKKESFDTNKRFTWIMSGTMDPNKNPVRFVEIALKYLSHRKHDAFIWLGKSTSGYSEYAKKLAEISKAGAAIRWVDPGDQAEYRRVMRLADGFIVTSDAESLSLVAIEALALGKPVVSFENGGIAEVLDSKTGIVIPRYDTGKCVLAMLGIARRQKRFDPRVMQRRAKFFHIDIQGPVWNKLLSGIVA